MAMTAEKLAYFREWRANNPDKVSAASKKSHEAHDFDKYYENLELTRAVKRKSYYTTKGDLDAAQLEQDKIDQIRLSHPRKQAGRVPYSTPERIARRKACVRKARYKHVKGLPDLLKEPSTCEICGESGKKMCLDHCHKTNVFRGWICDDCNVAIGLIKENLATLKAMIEYIQKENGYFR